VTSLTDVLQHGTAHAWLFVPTAILLGALHGLEPGHSKTMMAAFIIAIRGTIPQAVLLGLSAAISHSLIIWLLAVAALRYGANWNAETTEPYFHLISAIIVAGLAVWLFWRTRRDVKAAHAHHAHHHHDHEGDQDHDHDHPDHHDHSHGHGVEYEDAHEAAHAHEIRQWFVDRVVTTPQIIAFGLTGGLIPCPAAFTVLLVCLQVRHFTLGIALVGAFSLGLALTMVTVGATAAWSVHHAEKRFRGFGELMRKAPYLSCIVLVALAAFLAWQGWHGLAAHR
jgi:nickel/cobalt exporter